MKVIALTAHNLLRLRAVHIEPGDDPVVTISGPNGAGKTSVLQALTLAMGGGAAAKDVSVPIRDGEERAEVVVDLGDIVVTRVWTQGGSTLRVASADGAIYRSPQAMLDELIGRLSFDPLAFTRQHPKDQVQTLLDLVGLDPTELDAERTEIFEQRTETNREVKRLRGAMSEIYVPDDAPHAEVSVAALLEERTEAAACNAAFDSYDMAFRRLVDDAQGLRDSIRTLELRLADRRAELEHHVAAAEAVQSFLEGRQKIDLAPLDARIADAERDNVAARAHGERDKLAERLALFEATADQQTRQIAEIDRTKADAVANAEMPVDGIGLDPAFGVTFGGVPFSQASAAEQLRVSVAMAMAMNPTVRVIRITDGSLLDAASMEVIESLASENDYQVWVERVAEPGQGVGFEIHDGEVVA